MLRIFAVLFGIAFIFAGVAGFLPSFTQDGLLFGYFGVSMMHNVVHLLTGVISIMCATRQKAAKYFFIIFGFLYGVVAIAGFARGGDLVMMHVNTADNILHIVVAAVALYVGFSAKSSST